MSTLLNHTGAQDLDSSIRCSIITGHPFTIDRLQESLDDERQNSSRKTVIRLLEREIRRQHRLSTDGKHH